MNSDSNIKFEERTFPERTKTLNDYQEVLLKKALNFWKRYHKEKNSPFSSKNLSEKLKELDEFISEKKGKFVNLEIFENSTTNEILNLVKKLANKEKNFGFKSILIENENIKNEENSDLLFLRKPVLLENSDLYLGYWNLKGEIEGYGKLIKKSTGVLIEGIFQPDGNCEFGRYFFPNGNFYYEGNLANNLPNFKGELKMKIFNEKIYSGEWVNGKFNGKGIQFLGKNNEFKYEGNFANNFFSGFGILFYNNPQELNYSYQGNFEKNKFEGQGIFKFFKNLGNEENVNNNNNSNKNEEYNGLWKNGLPNGKGIYLWKNGNIYEGNYEEGKKKGLGKFIFNSGNSFFEGIWSNGKPNGKGCLYLEKEKDLKISGVWRQGKIQKIDNIEEFEKLNKNQNVLNIPIEYEIFSNDNYLNFKQITPISENPMDIYFDENNGKILSSNYFKIFAKGIEKNINNNIVNNHLQEGKKDEITSNGLN